ncbi:hypothetical protein GobsT_55530 [Gemmata obscuriglobus]|uniref:hypothetical protein n=1 Tax=Gemmata obscuriglobus TaxID=114 RepID=UPI00016C3AD7|nr:hypothetical protein [Gemmata obscuriglobus]QEG30741.1 hypothetical protein GobsT_55530 [Gemmata obscuriglobus]VTS10071.1 unnamed protein product [Gemmata obscuriglobus UQM 2246]
MIRNAVSRLVCLATVLAVLTGCEREPLTKPADLNNPPPKPGGPGGPPPKPAAGAK